VRDSDFFRPSEKFDRANIDTFQVNHSHPENFFADIVCFFVYTRDFDDLVRCEKRKDGCRGPYTQVVEDGFTRFRRHTSDQIWISLLDVIYAVWVDAIFCTKNAFETLHEIELAQIRLRSIRVVHSRQGWETAQVEISEVFINELWA